MSIYYGKTQREIYAINGFPEFMTKLEEWDNGVIRECYPWEYEARTGSMFSCGAHIEREWFAEQRKILQDRADYIRHKWAKQEEAKRAAQQLRAQLQQTVTLQAPYSTPPPQSDPPPAVTQQQSNSPAKKKRNERTRQQYKRRALHVTMQLSFKEVKHTVRVKHKKKPDKHVILQHIKLEP